MLQKACPVLASLDMFKTVAFYEEKLGFKKSYLDENYGIVHRDDITIHFWKCDNKIFPMNTGCYVIVNEVDELYKEMQQAGVVHPNGKLRNHPHQMREFAILDEDGNLIKFGQPIEK